MIERSRSLYSRIIAVITAVLGFGAICLGAAAWYYARIAADQAYDRLLVGAALQVAESIYAQDGIFSVDPPVSAFETLSLSQNDRIFYKVTGPRGIVLTGYEDLRSPRSVDEPTREPAIFDGEYRGFPVRIAVVGRYISDPVTAGWAEVTVAQTREARLDLARDLTTKALLIVLAMTALAFVGVLIAVRRALTPLARIERELRSRDPKDLSPLDVETPREIRTLVSSINNFMDRLSGRITLMQRFIADAAHQMRTPLTALASQVDLLTTETGTDRRELHLARVRERTSELGRLTNQLLSHAMVIHRAEVIRFERVDLVAIARQALINAVPLLSHRDVEISFDEAPGDVFVSGDAVSLREALSNVIHNALKHGVRTRLLVRVSLEGEDAIVDVIDDGPGIPASEWDRVRQPFSTRDGTGSGLGLAIVSDVVRAHGGDLSFGRRPQGFAVTLRFRRARIEQSETAAAGETR